MSDLFPTTHWSRFMAAGSPVDLKEAWGDLARAYGEPIQRWLACSGMLRDGDAHDAAQDFFVWMLEGDFLQRADPARGRFRIFLKSALRNFTIDRTRRLRAGRRGGGQAHSSLGGMPEVLEPAAPDPGPDEALDETWRRELLRRALQELEAECMRRDKAVAYRVFSDYYLSPDSDLDHAAVAERYGLTRTTAGNHLMFCKRLFRELLHRMVEQTVGSADDLQAELQWLFQGIKR